MRSNGEGHPSPDQLAAFDLGQLRAAEWAEVERHVAACAECCRKLEDLSDDPLVQLVRRSAGRPGETVDHGLASTGISSAATVPKMPAELAGHPRYRITGVLGAGGMGVVFKAEHRLMERSVALKVINAKLIDHPGAVERFRQEVKAAARLAHPNIVTAYDAEQAGDVHFLVMEFVEGASLDRVLVERGPLPVADACYLIQQAAQGLQHAFEKGMVHRDIKPANLILTYEGQVKVLDFGLSRFISETVKVEALTLSGAVVGTPDYIAPEQAAEPRSADIRADIYSLGCTIYHLLTGQPLFPGGSVLQKLIAHREKPAPSLTELRPDVPAELVQIVERMLAKEPATRWQTPAEVASALAAIAQAHADPAPRPSPTSRPVGAQDRAARARRLQRISIVATALLLFALAGLLFSDLFSGGDDLNPAPKMTETARPTSPATPPLADKMQQQARAQAIAWLRAHGAFNPQASFVPDRIKEIDSSLEKGGGCLMTLGPALVKSRRPTFLAVRGGQFFALDLSPEATRDFDFPASGSGLGVLPYDPIARALPPPVELADLKLDDASRLPADRTITGRVTCRIPADLTGKVAVRIAYHPGNVRLVNYHTVQEKPGTGPITIPFSAGTANPEGVRHRGPMWVFVDLCTFADRKKLETATVVSNAVAGLVVVVPPAEGSTDIPKKERPLLITSRPPDAQKGGLAGQARRDEMLAWFEQHNRDGPKSKLAAKWATDLSAVTKPADDIHVALGPVLVRSKKVTYLSAFGDGFFVFELTSEETQKTRIEGTRSRLDRLRHDEARQPQAEIADLRIASGIASIKGQQIVCSMQYKRLVEKTDDKLAVRIYRRVAGKDQCTYFDLTGPLPAATGKLTFYADWAEALKETENGPLIFFVELCLFKEAGKFDNLTVVSNTAAALVSVAPPNE